MSWANPTPDRKTDVRSLSAEMGGIRLHYLAARLAGSP